MDQRSGLHVLTVGWSQQLIEGLCARIAAKSSHTFSHLLHPMCDLDSYGEKLHGSHIHWFFDTKRMRLPPPDRELLASLEHENVSDRVASKLPYEEALTYASLVAKRLVAVLQQVQPSVVIGGFDGLHGSMTLAVARKLHIPWYALRFSVLPPGMAAFCENLSPASTISLRAPQPDRLLRSPWRSTHAPSAPRAGVHLET